MLFIAWRLVANMSLLRTHRDVCVHADGCDSIVLKSCKSVWFLLRSESHCNIKDNSKRILRGWFETLVKGKGSHSLSPCFQIVFPNVYNIETLHWGSNESGTLMGIAAWWVFVVSRLFCKTHCVFCVMSTRGARATMEARFYFPWL